MFAHIMGSSSLLRNVALKGLFELLNFFDLAYKTGLSTYAEIDSLFDGIYYELGFLMLKANASIFCDFIMRCKINFPRTHSLLNTIFLDAESVNILTDNFKGSLLHDLSFLQEYAKTNSWQHLVEAIETLKNKSLSSPLAGD